MNLVDTLCIPSTHRDAVRKLGVTRLALLGSLVHNQGQAEGKPDPLIEILGNDTREGVEVVA